MTIRDIDFLICCSMLQKTKTYTSQKIQRNSFRNWYGLFTVFAELCVDKLWRLTHLLRTASCIRYTVANTQFRLNYTRDAEPRLIYKVTLKYMLNAYTMMQFGDKDTAQRRCSFFYPIRIFCEQRRSRPLPLDALWEGWAPNAAKNREDRPKLALWPHQRTCNFNFLK